MASEVGICNSALIKLGNKTAITSIDPSDGSDAANICAEQYPIVRDMLLRAHNWNFATAQAQLAQLAAAPVFEFDYAYQLPSDWMRTIAVHDNDAGAGAIRYRMQGRTILSDANQIYLRYVQKITDPNTMDPLFRELLAVQLAFDLVIPITQRASLAELMANRLKVAWADATGADSVEDFPENWPDSDWLTYRN